MTQRGRRLISQIDPDSTSGDFRFRLSEDCNMIQPKQTYGLGGKARSSRANVDALAKAKEAGIDPTQALALTNWDT